MAAHCRRIHHCAMPPDGPDFAIYTWLRASIVLVILIGLRLHFLFMRKLRESKPSGFHAGCQILHSRRITSGWAQHSS